LTEDQRKKYRWFEELQKDDTLTRNRPSDPERNESLQFKLKAAEIAMAARDSSQVAQKADILKALFPEELAEFEPKRFDPKQFPFSESVERRERFVALLAQYPSSRKEIIRAWALLFPWDAASWGRLTPEEKSNYRWFEELQKDDTLTRNRPSDTPSDPA
jgi:hypothetical protein